ncbi:MAG: SRPBCC domain-containing protein [Bacteroidota bacterium]
MEPEILNNPDQSDWIKKTVEIDASDDSVWTVITNTELIKEWANAFEPGTGVQSEWTEGASVTWTDGSNTNVMKGRVIISYPGKMLKVGFYEDLNAADDAELGEYEEHYLLAEHEGKTQLTIETGPLTDTYIEKLSPQWDSALAIIKTLAENKI